MTREEILEKARHAKNVIFFPPGTTAPIDAFRADKQLATEIATVWREQQIGVKFGSPIDMRADFYLVLFT